MPRANVKLTPDAALEKAQLAIEAVKTETPQRARNWPEAIRTAYEADAQQVTRESAAGYHFVSTYLTNPYLFYLKYILGIVPTHTAKALVFGGEFHKTIAWAYEGLRAGHELGAVSLALPEVLKALLVRRSGEYTDLVDLADDLVRGPKMILAWANTWLEADARTYDLEASEIEHEHKVELANGYVMTIRPDRVLRNRTTGMYEPFDTKTTGWSLSRTGQNVQLGDQATAYMFGISKAHPDWKILGLVADVIYMKGAKLECGRDAIATRNAYDLRRFELNMIGLLSRMADDVQALDDGFPPELVFPRNPKDDNMFGTVYEPMMFGAPPRVDALPPGFAIDPRLSQGAAVRALHTDKILSMKENE